MASFNAITKEMDSSDPDKVRRAYLKKLTTITKRPCILYAVEMNNIAKVSNSPFGNQSIIISHQDKAGFREAIKEVEGDSIDVLLHSPGGSPEATESIVKMLRGSFKHVRFIVPSIAKSAATMMCMSGDEIILGDGAELGPTDPQMVINGKQSPAHAIIQQFEYAKTELSKDSSKLPAWIPILEQYGPALIEQCNNAIKLTKVLVKDWLKEYMFKGQSGAASKAARISTFLSGKSHLSHSRGISVPQLEEKGVNIKRASDVSINMADTIEAIAISIDLTFQRTGAVKFFENQDGTGMFMVVQQLIVPQ